MQNKTLWAVLAVVVVGAGLWYLLSSNVLGPIMQGNSSETPSATNGTGGTQTGANGAGGGATATSPTKTYANAAFGFSFDYPTAATIETTGITSTGGFKDLGAVGAVAVYTRFATLVDRITVNVSSGPQDVGTCTTPQKWPPETKIFNGVTFATHQREEQVQGQTVITTVYRTMRGTFCYEILDTVNSPNIDKLTAAEVKQRTADIAAATAFAESILQTFKFSR